MFQLWGEDKIVDEVELYGKNRLFFAETSMSNLKKETTTDYIKVGKGYINDEDQKRWAKGVLVFKRDLLPDVISRLQAIYNNEIAQTTDNDDSY